MLCRWRKQARDSGDVGFHPSSSTNYFYDHKHCFNLTGHSQNKVVRFRWPWSYPPSHKCPPDLINGSQSICRDKCQLCSSSKHKEKSKMKRYKGDVIPLGTSLNLLWACLSEAALSLGTTRVFEGTSWIKTLRNCSCPYPSPVLEVGGWRPLQLPFRRGWCHFSRRQC